MAAIAAALASCDRLGDSYDSDSLSLELSVVDLETKASLPGENGLNENKILDVDVFLYATDSENEAAVAYKRLAINKDLSDTKNLRLSTSELAKLGDSFNVFVIANRPESVNLKGDETISALKAKAISPSKPITETQDWFTMTGQAPATKDGTGFRSAIVLRRVMAKFGITVRAETEYEGMIDDVNGTWTPQAGTIGIKFYCLRGDGTMGGDYMKHDTDVDGQFHSSPSVFYSFPMRPLPEDKPYYVIKLTWALKGDPSVTKDTYYMVVNDYDTIDANNFYQLDVDITYAGSLKEPKPTAIPQGDLTFCVSDWRDGKIDGKNYHTEAVIKEARYLVVYANEYTMNNINSIDIPFTSSHPCKVRIESTSWTDFSATETVGRGMDDQYPSNYSDHGKRGTYRYTGDRDRTAVVKDGYFTLSHTLNNDFMNTTTYDVSPIVFTVQITHADKEFSDQVTKTVVVTQLPAITVRADNNTQSSNKNRFFNGSTGAAPGDLGGTVSPTTGEDVTQNMFIISISALPEGSPYVIGDPRKDEPVKWDDTGFFGPNNATKPKLSVGDDIDGDGKTMQYYYPAREDGTADNVVAPSLRTSSGWSRCGGYANSFAVVHKRAAVYQEKGLPAGRWRLLTRAEATILAKLNKDEKIPELFYNDHNFLVAGGFAMYKGQIYDGKQYGESAVPNMSLEGAVRLCYDEWYWSNSPYPKCNETTFTWGDMQR